MWWLLVAFATIFGIYHALYTTISGKYTYAILTYTAWVDMAKVFAIILVGFGEFWLVWLLDQIKWSYFIGFDPGQAEGDENQMHQILDPISMVAYPDPQTRTSTPDNRLLVIKLH